MNPTLLNIDCMEFMRGLPDKEFELAIVDPPYGIGMDGAAMSNRASNSPKFMGYKGKTYQGNGWDSKPMPAEYFIELRRVSRHQIVWGANHFIENLPSANSPSWIVWYKNGQNPQSTNADCELARTSHKTAVKYFRYDWSGFGAVNAGEGKIHPTQKPVKLYEWLLTNYAKPGDRILDTHGGSMSSVIACLNLGFEVTCCEKDPDYFAAACERIENAQRQQTMFAPERTKQVQESFA